MASTKVCSNCGAKNQSSNRFCEDCGYDMNKTTSSPVPTTVLYCPVGHTVSDPSLGFCDVCGEKLVSEKPLIEHEPVKSIPPVFESSGKKCPSCGAMNPADGLFCEECAAELDASYETDVAPVAPVAPEPVIHHAPAREIPDIPDIMRTLTNNDMKK